MSLFATIFLAYNFFLFTHYAFPLTNPIHLLLYLLFQSIFYIFVSVSVDLYTYVQINKVNIWITMASVPFFTNFTLQINICHQSAYLTMNSAFLCYKDSYFLLFREEKKINQLLCNHVIILSPKLEGKKKQYKQHTCLVWEILLLIKGIRILISPLQV